METIPHFRSFADLVPRVMQIPTTERSRVPLAGEVEWQAAGGEPKLVAGVHLVCYAHIHRRQAPVGTKKKGQRDLNRCGQLCLVI